MTCSAPPCWAPCRHSRFRDEHLFAKLEAKYGRKPGELADWRDPLYRWLVLTMLLKGEVQPAAKPDRRGRPLKVWDISGEPDPAVADAIMTARYLIKSIAWGGDTGKLQPKSLHVLRSMMERSKSTNGERWWAPVNLMVGMAIASFYREHPEKISELRGHTNKRITAERAINRVIRADRLRRFIDDPEDYRADPMLVLRDPTPEKGEDIWLKVVPSGKVGGVTFTNQDDEVKLHEGPRKAQQSYVDWVQAQDPVPKRIEIIDYLIEIGTRYNVSEALSYRHLRRDPNAWISVICPFHEPTRRWEQSGAFHPEQNQYRCYSSACLNGKAKTLPNLKAWWDECNDQTAA